MKVFLSYPHAVAATAESLATRLQAEGHDVFWDRTSLPPGESFDDRIRDAIDRSDLFVCLLTGDSLDEGHYARTELKFAREKWPNPSGRVLPVALDADVLAKLPPYLKAVTVVRPEGDPVAETADHVRRMARRPVRRVLLAVRIAAVVGIAGLIGWLSWRGLPGDPIQLTVGMSGTFYKDSAEKQIQVLRPHTDFVQLFEQGLRGEQHVDGEELLALLTEDEHGPGTDGSPLPVLHFRIANNSDATLIVDRLRLSVRESRIDGRPLLWTSSTRRGTNQVLNASFLLGNDGWGPAERVQFSFDIVPEKRAASASGAGSRRFAKDLPGVEAGGEIVGVFWDELSKFADISYLRDGPHPFDDLAAQQRFASDVSKLKAAIGAEGDEPVFAVGELSYTSSDGTSRKLSLRQQLQIVYPGPIVSPAMIATAAYDIELRPEGKDYVVERQIAHSIAVGAAEAIDLRVWVEKSSIHEMTGAIRAGGQWISASDGLRLEYYRPILSSWVKQELPDKRVTSIAWRGVPRYPR